MKTAAFFANELRSALEWMGKLVRLAALGIFRFFLRLALFGAFLLLMGGGCFLRFYLASNNKPDKQISNPQQPSPDNGYMSEQAAPSYRVNLQSQIRTGQSQVRSWDYTVRSIKNDMKRLFKQK